MATVTKTLGSISDAQVPPHYATLSVDYDDVALRLTLARVVNDTNATAQVTATAVANPTRSYTMQVPPGQTATQNIPTGATTRLDITIDARGRLDGVDYSFYLL